MTSGLLMVGAGVLVVYLWVTGQLATIIRTVTDAAKGQTIDPWSRAQRGAAGGEFITP